MRPGATARTAGLNYSKRSIRHGKTCQRVHIEPGNAARVAAGLQLATLDAAEEIDQNVVVFTAAAIIRDDAFEDSRDGFRYHLKSGFFKDLAGNRIFEALTRFDAATRQGPQTRKRRVAALDQQDAGPLTVLLQDHRADAQNRADRVATAAASGAGNRRLICGAHSL